MRTSWSGKLSGTVAFVVLDYPSISLPGSKILARVAGSPGRCRGLLLATLLGAATLPVTTPAESEFLSFIEGIRESSKFAAITFTPDGQYVYAASAKHGALAVFRRNAATGALHLVEDWRDGDAGLDGLDGARSVALSPDGRHVYVASPGDNAVAVFARDETDGTLRFVTAVFDGQGGIDGLEGAGSVTVSPDGNQVYVAGVFDDAVVVFARNAATGELSFLEVHFDDEPDGSYDDRSVVVSPDGRHLYVAGVSDCVVAVYARDTVGGTLSFVEVQRNGANLVVGLTDARSAVISPDGRHLYVACEDPGSVVVFARDAVSGALTFVEVQSLGATGVEGLRGARTIAITPDGEWVYAVSVDDAALVLFDRDPGSGTLGFAAVRYEGVLAQLPRTLGIYDRWGQPRRRPYLRG